MEGRLAHSLHAYFLRAGDPAVPIIYEVDRIRDGGSFSTRRVVAIQHGQAIFSMAASFQMEEGGLHHQIKMPDVPPPEALPSEAELKACLIDRLPPQVQGLLGARAADRDPPGRSSPATFSPENRAPSQQVWIRATGNLGDDPALHQCVLAYASDFTLLDTALIAHGRFVFDPRLMLASLDHALWFHRKFRADEWLLYAQDSPRPQARAGLLPRHAFHPRTGAWWPRRPKKGWSGSATADSPAQILSKCQFLPIF